MSRANSSGTACIAGAEQMNFFGIEISDVQFERAMKAARNGQGREAIAAALGFWMVGFWMVTGDVAAPPAGVISRES